MPHAKRGRPLLDATAKRTNKTPSAFDVRTNHKVQHHGALNRKVKGANRNVAHARAQALDKREKTLGVEFAKRKSATVVVDKRIGEHLSQEEKMARRFQRVRSKRRAGRFVLGDDAGGLTHMGQSLSADGAGEPHDDFSLDEDDAAELDEEERAHVEEMILRLKTGERFEAGDRKLSRKEMMADIIKKARTLRAERQQQKDADEAERERLDALAPDVATLLAPRDKHAARAAAEELEDFEYEATVRALAQESRAAPTDRTKTAEEIAQAELARQQELERERLRRMAGDSDDASANGHDDDDEKEEDYENDGPRAKRRRKLLKLPSAPEGDAMAAPFVLAVPQSHAELLELLDAHPSAPLPLLLGRILASNAALLSADNRARLVRFVPVLVEHASFAAQAGRAGAAELDAIFDCVYRICVDAPGPCAHAFARRLEQTAQVLDVHLARAAGGRGGDWGSDDVVAAVSAPAEKRGGHKGKGHERRLDDERAEQTRLARLRGDGGLLTSPSRCWPGAGELAVYLALPSLFSATDAHHPLLLASALLLARTLCEAPVRGPRDVVSAVEAARALQLTAGSPARRVVPEVALCLRACLMQAAGGNALDGAADMGARLHAAAAGRRHAGFEWLRRGLAQRADAAPATAMLGLGSGSGVPTPATCADVLLRLCALCERAAADVTGVAGAQPLLAPLEQPLRALAASGHPACAEACARAAEAVARAASVPLRPLHWQEAAESAVGDLNPRFGEKAAEAKEGQVQRALKRKLVRERKGVARELRRDGQFVAAARDEERRASKQQLTAERKANFAGLQQQQGEFNAAVRAGARVRGAGVGGLDLKGRRMGTREL